MTIESIVHCACNAFCDMMNFETYALQLHHEYWMQIMIYDFHNYMNEPILWYMVYALYISYSQSSDQCTVHSQCAHFRIEPGSFGTFYWRNDRMNGNFDIYVNHQWLLVSWMQSSIAIGNSIGNKNANYKSKRLFRTNLKCPFSNIIGSKW